MASGASVPTTTVGGARAAPRAVVGTNSSLQARYHQLRLQRREEKKRAARSNYSEPFQVVPAVVRAGKLAQEYDAHSDWGVSPYVLEPQSRRAIVFQIGHRNRIPALYETISKGAELETLSLLFECALEACRRPRVVTECQPPPAPPPM